MLFGYFCSSSRTVDLISVGGHSQELFEVGCKTSCTTYPVDKTFIWVSGKGPLMHFVFEEK